MTSPTGESSLNRANQLLEQGKVQEAVAEYRQGIGLMPGLSWSAYYLGDALTELGDWAGAVEAYQQAIALDANPLGYHRLGLALLKLERWDEAITVFNQGLDLNPDDYKLHLSLSQAWIQKQDWQAAIEALRRAADLEPEQADINIQLGQVLHRQGRIQEAVQSWQRALEINVEINNDDPQLLLALGLALVEANLDFERAETCLRRSLELQPDPPPDLYFHLGDVAARQGKLNDALGFYRRYWQLNRSLGAGLALADLLGQLNRWTEAIQQYRQLLLEFGESGEALLGLGRGLAALGRPIDAVVEWRRAVVLGWKNPELHHRLAEALVTLGLWDEAIVEWGRLLVLQPGNAKIRRQRALALMSVGRWPEAAGEWQQYWQIAPGSAQGQILDFRSPLGMYGEIPHQEEWHLTGDLTIEFWLCLRQWPQDWINLVGKFISDEQNDFCVRLKDGQQGHWYYGNGESCARPVTWRPQEKIRLHQWVHIACVRKQGQYGQVYVDGVLQGERDWSGESDAVRTEAPVRLMANFHQSNHFPDGLLSEVRLWNLARNGDEIRAGMYESLTETDPGLVAVWLGSEEGGLVNPAGEPQGQIRQTSAAATPRSRVGICGWELSHQAAGRVYTLAQLYRGFTQVELIGCLFPQSGGQISGGQISEPLHWGNIPCHTQQIEDEGRFLEQALDLVLAHPYEVVHLSKPRMPNIILGLLSKLIWDARVIVDFDDEELSGIEANQPLNLGMLLESGVELPPGLNWLSQDWTRIAVALARGFDGLRELDGTSVSDAEAQRSLVAQVADLLGRPSDRLSQGWVWLLPRFPAVESTGSRLGEEQPSRLGAARGQEKPVQVEVEKADEALDIYSAYHQKAAFIFPKPAKDSQEPRFVGRLDQFNNNELTGWLADSLNPGQPSYLNIFVNNILYRQIFADRQRPDLPKILGYSGFGFLVDIPYIAKCKHKIELTATPVGDPFSTIGKGSQAKPILIQDFPTALGWSRNPLQSTQLPHPTPNPPTPERTLNPEAANPNRGNPAIAIIVPIFNAYNELCQCLESLAKNTYTPAQLILIDDGSTDARVASKLEQFSQTTTNVLVSRNEKNLGYTASINKGIHLAEGADIVLLNSDTVVTPGWLRNLKIAAYSAVDIATVTALSNNAGAFSIPEDRVNNSIPSWIDQQSFARWVTQESLALYPDIPTGNGFCFYIRRDALNDLGLFDEQAFPRGYGEENDFCFRALTQGWRNIIDDRTVIYHVRSASFGEHKAQLAEAGRQIIDQRYPEYAKAVRSAFTDSSVMATLRFNIRQNLHHYPRFCLPRVLYVIHSESGGTPQTTRDLIMKITGEWEPFLLLSHSNCLKLYDYRGQTKRLVEEFPLRDHITASNHDSAAYRRFVEHILIRYGIELLHIRHIGRHGLSLTAIAKKLNLPVLFSFHDYYTVTPNIKLLDYRDRYCLDQWSDEEARRHVEIWDTKQSPRLDDKWRRRWQTRMSEMLSFCDAFVTTSEQAREIIQSVFPVLKEREFRIIPHGRKFNQMLSLGRVPSDNEPIRILVPGHLAISKGSIVLKKIKDCDHNNRIEFHFLGNPEPSLDEIGIQHGPYERDSFLELVAQIQPHLGAVLSIWPETYCHTLTELWAGGLPVIGFSVGAVGERLQEHGGGWLLNPSDPEQIYRDITQFYTSPDEYQEKLEQVLAWQRGYGSTYDTQAMSRHYLKLYRSLQEKQLNFVTLQDSQQPTKAPSHRQLIEVLYSPDDATVPHHRKALRQWLSEHYAHCEFTWQQCSYHELLDGDPDITIGSDDLVILSLYELTPEEAERFLSKFSHPDAGLHLVSLLEEYKTRSPDASQSGDSLTLMESYERILKESQAILAIGTNSWVELVSQHLRQNERVIWKYGVATEPSWPQLVKRLVVQGNDQIDWLQAMKKGQSRKNGHVSIVIPVYGKQDLTRQCLESIFSLSHSSLPYEVLVVDNGSPDETASMVREMQAVYPNLQLIRSRKNVMFASGCNLGIVASEGEYIVLLNNDTVVSANWLDNLIEPLREDITLGMTGPKLMYSDNTLQAGGIVFGNPSKFPYHIYKGMPADYHVVNQSRYFQALTGACVAVRALDLIAVEGLDPVFVNGSEDLDLCFKIRKNLKKKLLYCPDSQIIHYEGKTPGRGRYSLHNRQTFVDKWQDSIEIDDVLFYENDGFGLDGYSTDERELMDREIAAINARLYLQGKSAL
ncbi:MAG: glycosyltransferase [Phormidium sp. GEM2.Bin31]|nr:MAG: glycosyltransferase [Phormidium sp. GEM2.Bin31]